MRPPEHRTPNKGTVYLAAPAQPAATQLGRYHPQAIPQGWGYRAETPLRERVLAPARAQTAAGYGFADEETQIRRHLLRLDQQEAYAHQVRLDLWARLAELVNAKATGEAAAARPVKADWPKGHACHPLTPPAGPTTAP